MLFKHTHISPQIPYLCVTDTIHFVRRHTFCDECWSWEIVAVLWWPCLSWPRLAAIKKSPPSPLDPLRGPSVKLGTAQRRFGTAPAEGWRAQVGKCKVLRAGISVPREGYLNRGICRRDHPEVAFKLLRSDLSFRSPPPGSSFWGVRWRVDEGGSPLCRNHGFLPTRFPPTWFPFSRDKEHVLINKNNNNGVNKPIITHNTTNKATSNTYKQCTIIH